MLQYLSSSAESLAPLTPGVSNLYQQFQQQQQAMSGTAPTTEDTASPVGTEDSLTKQLLQRIKHPLMRSVSKFIFMSIFNFFKYLFA